eukprot:6492162-Amphidinium_carterae.1
MAPMKTLCKLRPNRSVRKPIVHTASGQPAGMEHSASMAGAPRDAAPGRTPHVCAGSVHMHGLGLSGHQQSASPKSMLHLAHELDAQQTAGWIPWVYRLALQGRPSARNVISSRSDRPQSLECGGLVGLRQQCNDVVSPYGGYGALGFHGHVERCEAVPKGHWQRSDNGPQLVTGDFVQEHLRELGSDTE